MYPSGLPLKTVSFGQAVVLESGTALPMRVTVKASRSLVHRPSGSPLVSLSTLFEADLPEGTRTLDLPVCDSTDMGLGNGQPITLNAGEVTHTYTATIEYLNSDGSTIASATRVVDRFVLLTADPSTIDLDDVLTSPTPTQGVPSELLIPLTQKGAPGGVATLDGDGLITVEQIPSGIGGGAPAGIDVSQQLMGVLATESRDASMMVVGDSTGNDITEWVYLVAQWLATEHPTWTVQYRLWNDGTVAYGAATTLQTGTGARTLTIYNASVSGFTTTSWQAARFAAAIAPYNPDLCFISLGHNEGAATSDVWFSRYIGLSEEIALQLAATPIILVAQNPVTANTNQQARRDVYREIAQHRGYGFIDVCKAFEDLPVALADLLMPDGVHPNETGSQLWANTVIPHLQYEPTLTPHPIGTSTLGIRGANLLLNSDFSAMSGALPDHWGGANVTAARDTVNYESYAFTDRATGSGGSPTSVKFTGTGAGQATIQQFVPTNLVKGKWVTLAMRIYVPIGQASSVGRAALVDSGGSTLSGADTQPQGRFRWAVNSRFIPLTASYCRAQLYVDSNVAGTGNCTIDRVSMVVGKYPLAP